MLLDGEAKKSAFSVFESFKNDAGKLGFKFVPPNLKGWQLEVSVLTDPEESFTEVIRVERIVEAILNENASDVLVNHPKTKDQSAKSKVATSKNGHVPADDIDPELDLGDIPGLGKRLHNEQLKGFSFSCSGIRSVKSSKGKKAGNSKRAPSTEGQDTKKEKAGIGIAEKDGYAQEFSPSINQDDEITETVDLPQKFSLFAEVIEEVSESDGIKLVQEAKCYRFPEPSNNSRVVYQTQYEDRLKYFVAILDIKGSNLILVEADTNNLEKPKGASTLILGLKENATENFEEILQNFSDKGAQWSHAFIEERCDFFSPCRHPLLKEKGIARTDQEYKEKWVDDMKEKLSEFKTS
ncbi:Tn7-like element transposition protein TnsE [Marinomonas sp. RSW2]|uniref:Tn7-like element transposition protein TnsE n=1 Tax=Marinomonas maritima TaxID=2940935 RepID=A0ABT5WB86_9GAMM|nr:Tn7-like element transposition protein TnsE [Marinomonas maritima]MDE8601604.1 Tn7-like element transposition protein TnsE [Marinomonas maritima]